MSLIILTIISALTLILFLFLNSTAEKRAELLFRFTVLWVLCWTVSIFFTELDSDPNRVLFWSRLSFFFPIFISLFLHYFSFRFVGPILAKKIFAPIHYLGTWIFSILGAVFAFLCFTPLILAGVRNLHSSFGPLQSIYSIYILLSFTYVIYLQWLVAKQTKGRLHSQSQLILSGVATSSLWGIVTNLTLPILGLGEIRVLGPLGTLFFIGSITYAILAQHLFDIRVIIRRTIVYTILLGVIFSLYTALIILFTQTIGYSQPSSQGFYANLLATLIVAFSFDPLRRWLEEKTERFLFKREYQEQEVVKELSQKLNNVVAMDEALEIVMQSTVHVLHLEHAATFVFQRADHGNLAIRQIKEIGYEHSVDLILGDEDFCIPYFEKHPEILIVDSFQQEIEHEKNQLQRSTSKKLSGLAREHAIKQAVLRKLLSLGAALVLPLHIEDQLIGLVLLSNRLSGDSYSSDDLNLLETIGVQAISSIQKANLYEGDRMKSEFVSIASHELLTPISAIEGYLSMILDEHIGKVDAQATEYLTKVYTSARRLSTLIKDLLSVSRIESGRLKIELQAVDISKMINETIDQLRFVAKEKKLSLTYLKPTTPIPKVKGDPDRLSEIIINLISNGIKYTPKGGVTLRTYRSPDRPEVVIEVTDSGIGINAEQQAHLFEKFYRIDSEQTAGIGGTGLGLYITKSMVEKMNGSIQLQSQPGKGSTFSFTLPIFEPETSKLAA